MKNKSISFVIIGILLLLVPVMFFLTSSGIKNAGLVVNTNELNTTWYYVNEEGAETPIQMESKYDCKVNEEFIIYTHINEENDYNTLLIESSQQRIKVFLDEELLFDNSTEESRLFGKAEQSKFNLVSLPHGIEGKTIKISLTCPFEKFSGKINKIKIGYREAFVTNIYNDHFPYLCFSFFLFISSLVLLFSTFIFVRSNKEIKRMIGLLGAIIFLSLCLICESKILSLYGSRYLSGISYMSLILFAILFGYYMLKHIQNIKLYRAIYIVITLSIGQLLFSLVSHFIGFLDLFETLPITLFLILIELVIFTLYKIYEVVYNGKNKVLKKRNIIQLILVSLIFISCVGSICISYARITLYIVPCSILLIYIFYRYALSVSNVISDAKMSVEYESQLKETKNYLIQSQMKSHFIFNTLGAIRTMIVSKPNTAYDMMTDFTKYLRANISNISPNEQIPFAQELDHIKAYVNIEKQRFQHRLNVVYDIKCDDFSIPPLSVEPLVENAVKHGVCKRLKGGTVKISTYEDETKYYVLVEDDGIGFDTEILEQESKKDSVGLKYIKIRLETLANAEFYIESVPKKGTKATIIIKK